MPVATMKRRVEKNSVHTEPMRVWVRIVALAETDAEAGSAAAQLMVNTSLAMTIYRTREQAEKEQRDRGGIALEVIAATLPRCFSSDSVPRALSPLSDAEWDKNQREVLLTCTSDAEEVCSRDVDVSVSYADLPHKTVLFCTRCSHEKSECDCDAPSNEQPAKFFEPDLGEFEPEAVAWLERLQKESGLIVERWA